MRMRARDYMGVQGGINGAVNNQNRGFLYTDGLLGVYKGRKFGELSDGTSNTIAIGENSIGICTGSLDATNAAGNATTAGVVNNIPSGTTRPDAGWAQWWSGGGNLPANEAALPTTFSNPVVEGRAANAQINEDGTFDLSYTNLNDGLPAGEYKVVIVSDIFKPNAKAMEAEEAMKKRVGSTDTVSMVGNGELIHVVPPEYNDVRTTTLKQIVASASGKQQFEFDIPMKKKK